MKPITLILDLDGVLITTPPWKADEISSDGYSEFNESCVKNINKLLGYTDFEVWLSSTRRTVKTLDEFNQIFKNRNITNRIIGFLPICSDCNNRKEEVLNFIETQHIDNYLIIDDDKSLNGLESEFKNKLVLTEMLRGFNKENLEQAIEIINTTKN